MSIGDGGQGARERILVQMRRDERSKAIIPRPEIDRPGRDHDTHKVGRDYHGLPAKAQTTEAIRSADAPAFGRIELRRKGVIGTALARLCDRTGLTQPAESRFVVSASNALYLFRLSSRCRVSAAFAPSGSPWLIAASIAACSLFIFFRYGSKELLE